MTDVSNEIAAASERIAWYRYTRRHDWGNSTQTSFAKRTLSWPTWVREIRADDFSKIALKRHPEDKLVWSFAMEWNKSLRIIGFFEDDEISQSLSAELHQPSTTELEEGWRYRQEISLADEDDQLFHCWTDEDNPGERGNVP